MFRLALTLTAVTAMIALSTGCGKTKSGEGSVSLARPTQQSAAARAEKPLDEIGSLLADLDGGDVAASWRAEELLGAKGPWVAPRVRTMLGASTPEARAAACRLAYKFTDTSSIAGMIELLGDKSRLVRNTANYCLCGLTNQDFRFRPDAMPEDQAAAKARWESWYVRNYGPLPASKQRK